MKHQSFGAFCCEKELLAFGFIYKDETKLLRNPPVVEIQMPDVSALQKVLSALLQPRPLDFAIVDTAIFAYEPVLKRLKSIKELPLDDCLLNSSDVNEIKFEPTSSIQRLVKELDSCLGQGGSAICEHPVDDHQIRSIINALTQPVSAILGPPGRFTPKNRGTYLSCA